MPNADKSRRGEGEFHCKQAKFPQIGMRIWLDADKGEGSICYVLVTVMYNFV